MATVHNGAAMIVPTIHILLLLVLPVMSVHQESSAVIEHHDSEPPPQLQTMPAKQECPTWFIGNRSSGCECHEVPGVVCKSNYVLVLNSHCVTYYADREQLQAALCPFNFGLSKSDYVRIHYIKLPESNLDVNEYFCAKLKRTGVLCSKCQTGLGPPVLSYSIKCIQCLPSPYGWLLYILLACFPTTVFSLLVFLFQIRANSPQLNVIVFLCQYLALVQVHSPQQVIGNPGIIIVTFYGLWNLEFFRYTIPPFCISGRMSLVDVYALEYLVAICPLFLVVLIYVSVELHARGCKVLVCLWKPFRICCTRTRRWMDPRGSIVNVFATLLVLSYTKLIITSLYLLRYTHFYSNTGERIGHKMAYLDATTHYSSVKYLPYMLLSSCIVAFLVVLPALFLCLYPLRPFQRCLNRCGLSRHALHAFADSFNGHYKNRTDNTHDCRYFGSFYLVLRILVFVAYMVGVQYRWFVQIILGVIAIFLFLWLRPYKDELFNVMDSFLICIWTVCILVNLYDFDMKFDTPMGFYYAVGLVPLAYFILLAILKLLVYTKFYRGHLIYFHKTRNLLERFVGYQNRESEACRQDSELAHRILDPALYTPLNYGAINS